MTLDLVAALRLIGGGPSVPASDRKAAWAVIDEVLADERVAWISQQVGVTSDQEDVRQTVLEKLLAGRTAFRGASEGEARSFLRALVRYTAIDLRRQQSRELPLLGGELERSGSDATSERMDARDLQRRLAELVDVAHTIQDRPAIATLQRHLKDALLGQPAADPSLQADSRVRAALRKERQRCFDLLRRAQAQLLDSAAESGRPDSIDRLIAQLIAARTRYHDD